MLHNLAKEDVFERIHVHYTVSGNEHTDLLAKKGNHIL